MKAIIHGSLAFVLALGLSACGKTVDVADLKSTVGMSKEQIESKFGMPQSSSLQAAADHPGGYWVYQAKSGPSCKLRFDLPPRVVGVDC